MLSSSSVASEVGKLAAARGIDGGDMPPVEGEKGLEESVVEMALSEIEGVEQLYVGG